MECLIRADGLTKDFGSKRAVSKISLTVNRGEVLGFLGPNGAGKTTTMKMLTGFLAPTQGSAEVCGRVVTSGDPKARSAIGYLPEGAPLYGDMTVTDFLNFTAKAHGLRVDQCREAVAGSMDALQLQQVGLERIETLSKGYKRRVGLAAAILHNPDVLILDEPTDGLDPNQKHQVRGLIQAMASERAIIISTHILEEVEALCSRAIIIARGSVVADGTPAALKKQSVYAGAVSVVVDKGDAQSVAERLDAVDGVASVEQQEEGGAVKITALAKEGADLVAALGDVLGAGGWTIHAYGVETGRLDDVFRSLTKGGVS